jgi:ACS family glucarate transporter-like MFS transporter
MSASALNMGQSEGVGGIARKTNVRWLIVSILFIVTAVNYADRSAIAIVGPVVSKDLGLDAAQMGIIFSAFGWAYVIGQLPGGWLLDRFGSKTVYGFSLLFWSICTLCQGLVGFLAGGVAIAALFLLLFLLGLAESPAFPGNSRIVAAWFPKQERGTASAIFNSAQYFATVMFAPLIGWITSAFGWPWVFGAMGGVGLTLTFIWLKFIHNPADHPMINKAELDYIADGGGLVHMDDAAKATGDAHGAKWDYIRQLFASRMMVGIFLGQFCINAITYFFITWFPVYLVQARGMSILKVGFVAAIPAICGFSGGILGGVVSDWLIRRGWSLTTARKTPIVLGMSLALTMIAANYTNLQWVVVTLMALAFFGKGFGALGWAVMSDAAPKEITGLAGAVFNMCGNLSAISTPLIIGTIVQVTGSFDGALVFIGANAVVAAFSYLFIVGEIKRMELQPLAVKAGKFQ